MVNLTIDGKKVAVAEGTTVLKAAGSAGIYIPTLCYHPKVAPIGACRVCVVEVEGENRLVASCDTPVREGMVVRTQSDEITHQRKQMLQLVLLHHPLDCPVCDKAGECDLQDMTVELGVLEQPFTSVKPEKAREDLSPLLTLWHTRCIMCGRCVQVCKEVQGARAIDYVVRKGIASKVGPTETDGYPCESCSQCLSACPVGAILDSRFLYSARAWQLDRVDSVCTFCGVGCSRELNVRDSRVYRVTVRNFQGTNRGNLCSRGRFGADIVHSEARLTSPAVRKNGSLHYALWDDALDYAAQRLKEIVASEGGASVAGLASARCSNEALYMFQRLMREGLGTARIDTPAHLNNLALIETLSSVYGVPASAATLKDIKEADTILVLDSNIINSHPVAALEVLQKYRSGSAKVLVAGHRSNKLTTQCTQFARTRPGSEAALLNCLAYLLTQNGAMDDRQEKTEGFDRLKTHVAGYSPSKAARATGVDADIISEIADAIVSSKQFLLILSPGSLHSSLNSSIARAAANIAVLKGGKILSLLREGNAQGALDMGMLPDFLPGYKEVADAQSGILGVADILKAVETGEIKALYLLGGDIRRELSLLGFTLETLRSLECLIVQDIFGGPVAEMAHIVLPACSSAERNGSYTSAYRIIQNSPAAIAPMGRSRPDLEILGKLSHKLGLPLLDSVGAVRDQIASSVSIYDSMNGQLLQSGGTWDYSKIVSSTRPKLFTVGESAPATDDAHPYVLVFDNALHYGGSSSLYSPSLAKVRIDEAVEVGEDDATTLGLEEGAVVELSVKGGGSTKLPVRVSRELPAGVLSVPAHNYDVIQELITKLDPSIIKAEEGAPVWPAGIKVAKD